MKYIPLLVFLIISSCQSQADPKHQAGICLMSPDGFFYKIESLNDKDKSYEVSHWNSINNKWENIKFYSTQKIDDSTNYVSTACP